MLRQINDKEQRTGTVCRSCRVMKKAAFNKTRRRQGREVCRCLGKSIPSERRANEKALGWEQPSVFTEQRETSMAE